MKLSKVPLFTWMILFTSFLIIAAMPVLAAIQGMLFLDRNFGAHFFDTQAGGSAVLWQHLFWYFGHPEVYILALPAFGIISEVVPVFSRKVIFGYESVAAATVAIGFISLGVWAHHMFAIGMNQVADDFFAGMSFLIAIPTGIKIFNWVATLYGGRLRLQTPLLFSLGFLSMFLIGGLTGIMLAVVPISDDTVYAYFDVDERTYLDLVGEKPAAKTSDPLKELKLPVLMRLANSEEFAYPGYVDFLDNRINGNTGSIRMRGVFPNPRDTLKSGLFVRIRLPVGQPYRALLISDEALQSDQGRKYVYVVKAVTDKNEDGSEETREVVEYRPVTLGQSLQGLRVINVVKKDADGTVTEGLETGDRVIVSGMQRVRPGTVVHVKVEPPPKPPGFPLLKLLAARQGDKETRRQGDKEIGEPESRQGEARGTGQDGGR